mmetsp:Transcript_19131/g.49072  ORF Transcript_19131/g.49072 Transcript_19131/m.49072 type:complete len:214 (+) Transcript_19131:482-1123(+)
MSSSARPAAPAPRLSSSSQVALWPASAATTSGVQSWALTASMGAPWASSRSQMSEEPTRAARCSAVSSQASQRWTEPPRPMSLRTMAMLPPLAAACSGVQPHTSSPVTLVTPFRSVSTSFTSPFRQARISSLNSAPAVMTLLVAVFAASAASVLFCLLGIVVRRRPSTRSAITATSKRRPRFDGPSSSGAGAGAAASSPRRTLTPAPESSAET